jgi:hypothetical protein
MELKLNIFDKNTYRGKYGQRTLHAYMELYYVQLTQTYKNIKKNTT